MAKAFFHSAMKHLFQNQAGSPLVSTPECSRRPCFPTDSWETTKPAKDTRVAQFDIKVNRTDTKLSKIFF